MDELKAQDPQSIQTLFGGISKKYDLANSVLSFGIHHLWKRTLVRQAQIKKNDHVLDCATGTGDLAFLFEKELQGSGQVVATDFCQPMLNEAISKAKLRKSKIQFEFADVMHLPYSENQFDVASISFGIRNVKDTQTALSELGRVTKPGGKVLILEFGQPRSQILSFFYNLYSNQILPKVGGLISGKPEAYRYLQTSSAEYPCGENFLNIARSTQQFSKLSFSTFQSGIAYLYLLQKNDS